MRTRFVLALALVTLAPVASLRAQTPQEMRRAFNEIRDDDRPNNCSETVLWLYQRREKLRPQILEEVYKSDRQGRDALMILLFKTASFVPDQRFTRFVMARLGEENRFVPNGAIDPDPEVKEGDAFVDRGAHHVAWSFIDSHYAIFEPLLLENVATTKNLWSLWSTAWVMKKRGGLASHGDVFTPEILARTATQLRNDKARDNASQAARIFLLLGERSLPVLREAARSNDAQAKSLALALTDALKAGSKKAFGYLNSKVYLARTPFGPEVDDPAWMDGATEPYLDREIYP